MGSVVNAFRWPKQDSLSHLARVWGYQPDLAEFLQLQLDGTWGKQEGGGRKCLTVRASRAQARFGREAACGASFAGS